MQIKKYNSRYTKNKGKTNKGKTNKGKTLKRTLNKQFQHNEIRGGGGNAPQDIDLQSLSKEEIQYLIDQGISAEQLADMATQKGQPVPPLINELMGSAPPASAASMPPMGMDPMGGMGPMPPTNNIKKTSNAPAMMGLPKYATYNKLKKEEELEKLEKEQEYDEIISKKKKAGKGKKVKKDDKKSSSGCVCM